MIKEAKNLKKGKKGYIGRVRGKKSCNYNLKA